MNYEIPIDKWKKIIEDFDMFLDISRANLTYGTKNSGDDLPLRNLLEDKSDQAYRINESEVWFNGREENDQGHETFWFTRKCPSRRSVDPDKWFAFCKTAHKPYDEIVCCFLLIAKKHLGDMIVVSSDGDWFDWLPTFENMDCLDEKYFTRNGYGADRLSHKEAKNLDKSDLMEVTYTFDTEGRMVELFR